MKSGRIIQTASAKLTNIEGEITTLANHGVGTRSKSRHQRSPGVYGLHNQWHRARSHVGRMGKEKAQIPRRGPKGQQPIGTWEVGRRYLWARSSTSRGLQTCPPGHLAPLDGWHHWEPWSEDHPTDLARSRRSWKQFTGWWPNNKHWEMWFWAGPGNSMSARSKRFTARSYPIWPFPCLFPVGLESHAFTKCAIKISKLIISNPKFWNSSSNKILFHHFH